MKLAFLSVVVCAALAQVPYDLIRRGPDTSNWPTYSGNLQGHHFSPLQQITPANVRQLRPAWIHTAGSSPFETTPLVVNGIMYITELSGIIRALDARTGRTVWRYQHPLPSFMPLCCGAVNRGVALLDDLVYYGTPDAHLIALEAKTGRKRWDVVVADVSKGYSITSAPLAVPGKIITGIAGGEFGIRGFLDAYDARTGKRVWRFDTIPGPGEPGNNTWAGDSWKTGGVPTWVTGSYDPDANVIYWGTGNPGPLHEGENRAGDNLYSNSIIAVDAGTGKLRWYFQTTPHDLWDFDATNMPVLFDAVANGTNRRLVAQANRNGFFYLLDRQTGEYLVGRQYGHQTWADGLDEKGRPKVRKSAIPTRQGARVAPDIAGVTNWRSPSYSPVTGLLYVAASITEAMFYTAPAKYREGTLYTGGMMQLLNEEKHSGTITAIRATTGEVAWEFPLKGPTYAGLLSTASGLVFGGTRDGAFFALDAATGKHLWHFNAGGLMQANPVSYAVGGKQYVVMASGGNLISYSLP